MSITTLDGLVAALPGQFLPYYKANRAAKGSGTWVSYFGASGTPGAGNTPPAEGEVPIAVTTTGSFAVSAPGAGHNLYLGRASAFGSAVASLIVYDRLWHNSGLSGTSGTEQAVNSIPLTRPDALGAGVEVWVEWYAATGGTSATLTLAYTNSAGDNPRSATTSFITSPSIGQMLPLALQAGDTGVRSIQSVTLSQSTQTAGNFGLVLLRRLITLPIAAANSGATLDAIALGLPRVYPSACLALAVLASGTTTGNLFGELAIVEG